MAPVKKSASRRRSAKPVPREHESKTVTPFGSWLGWALACSLVLLGLRLRLAELVGFGDAEALYAAYALHPQPAYLDHPGLIGVLSRFIGDGAAPTALAAHRFTAFVSTAIPWVGVAAARATGTRDDRVYLTFFALALLPEMSVGLFGLTPDLPLAVLWLSSLACAALALRSAPGSRAALVGMMLAGLLAGLSITAKATGVLLAASIAVAVAGRGARAHLRTVGPYFGAVAAVIVVVPLALWERAQGYPLLSHRFVATQSGAGLSLRNAAGLVFGQLLYVTPPFLWQAARSLRELFQRRDDPVDRLQFVASAVPAVPLAALCLWSRVAEPHWLGPAYLSLAVALPRLGPPHKWVTRSAVAIGVVAPIAAFVLVSTPLVPKLSGKGYRPRYDLVNDLYAWQAGLPLVRAELAEVTSEGYAPVVVGPHWTVCAQLHAGLGASIPVGCRTHEGDDFAGWFPPRTWSDAPVILYVTDDRFPEPPAAQFPHRDVVRIQSAQIYRGGRVVRTIRVARLERAASALR
jgi:hypothetical protein